MEVSAARNGSRNCSALGDSPNLADVVGGGDEEWGCREGSEWEWEQGEKRHTGESNHASTEETKEEDDLGKQRPRMSHLLSLSQAEASRLTMISPAEWVAPYNAKMSTEMPAPQLVSMVKTPKRSPRKFGTIRPKKLATLRMTIVLSLTLRGRFCVSCIIRASARWRERHLGSVRRTAKTARHHVRQHGVDSISRNLELTLNVSNRKVQAQKQAGSADDGQKVSRLAPDLISRGTGFLGSKLIVLGGRVTRRHEEVGEDESPDDDVAGWGDGEALASDGEDQWDDGERVRTGSNGRGEPDCSEEVVEHDCWAGRRKRSALAGSDAHPRCR
jgi:hypothetical protein